MIDIADVLKSLCPNVEWALDGAEIIWERDPDSLERFIPINLIWYSENIDVPTKEQIETRTIELQAIADSIAYQDQRKKEYPPLTDLADALFWQANGDNSKMTAYLAQVAAVKDRYPKGTA